MAKKMTKKLNDTPEGIREAFEIQLAYEVHMLRYTYNFLQVRSAWGQPLENAIIESFCVHARNLIDFFNEKSVTPSETSKDSIGAKHFCNGYKLSKSGKRLKGFLGRLNNQISHLTYARTSKDDEKIGAKEQKDLINLIETEIELFGSRLKQPYKWPPNPSRPSSSLSETRGATGAAAPTVAMKSE